MFIYSWNIFTGSIPEVWIELEKHTKRKKKTLRAYSSSYEQLNTKRDANRIRYPYLRSTIASLPFLSRFIQSYPRLDKLNASTDIFSYTNFRSFLSKLFHEQY